MKYKERKIIGGITNEKIYKKAIEEALNKNVEKVYIYSVYLNKEVLVK